MFAHDFDNSSSELSISTSLSSVQGIEGTHPLNSNSTLRFSSHTISGALNQAWQDVSAKLSEFASNPKFVDQMNHAFGMSWSMAEAEDLFKGWSIDNFSGFPQIEISSDLDIIGANGAFAGETSTIYLSSDFLAQNANHADALANVLLEEIGHAIDFRINDHDAAGDEGDLFCRLLRGETLSTGELLELKVENDHAMITLNGKSIGIEMSQIAMTSLNGVLYQAHQGTDNQIYTRSTADGVNWTDWNNNGGGTTYSAPALTTVNGKIYQAHRGADNSIYTRSTADGVNWTDWNNNGGGTTYSAPTMAAFNGKLYQAHRGTDDNLYIRSSTDGVNWTDWNNNGGGSSYNSPTLIALNGKLYESHRGTDDRIYTRSSTDGVNWTDWNNNGGGVTYSAPALSVFNGKLYQTHRGTDNRIYTRSSVDGANWSNWSDTGGETPDAPSLSPSHGRLYQAHQGTDNRIYTRWTTDGSSWSAWTQSGGVTPTEFNDLNIKLDFFGNFTQSQKNSIQKAAQNWENIITRDMVPSGVLRIAIDMGQTGLYAETQSPAEWPIGSIAQPGVRYNQPVAYDTLQGTDYDTRITFNSNNLSTAESKGILVRLAMHEIAHALYLDEAYDSKYGDGDSSLGLDSLMDRIGLDTKISEGMYEELERLGYRVNRDALISWS